MTTNNHVSPVIQTHLGQIVKNLAKILTPGTVLDVDGKPMTVAEASKEAAHHLTFYDDADEARDEATLKVALRNENDPEARAFVANLEGALHAKIGKWSKKLTKVGYELPRERRKLTSAENEARAQKARATRLANGTLGKRQKAAKKKARENGK